MVKILEAKITFRPLYGSKTLDLTFPIMQLHSVFHWTLLASDNKCISFNLLNPVCNTGFLLGIKPKQYPIIPNHEFNTFIISMILY